VLRTRLATAAVALPALWLLTEFLPLWLFAGFIVAVTAIGLYEYFEMAFAARPWVRVGGVAWGILLAGGIVSLRAEVWGAVLAGGLMIALVGALLGGADDLPGAMQGLGLTVLGVLYVGFFTPHIVLLRAPAEGWRLVLFTVYVAMGSDSGGYFAGRAFGRHKLAPAVSPSKTVEGALGAVAGAVVIAAACRLVFVRALPFAETLVVGAVISILAQLGDLAESALKRAFGAKDSGWIIPGHGGILDRLDSLLFPFVFTYYYAALRAA
jgi:phosphatidate cytidylyltransferase